MHPSGGGADTGGGRAQAGTAGGMGNLCTSRSVFLGTRRCSKKFRPGEENPLRCLLLRFGMSSESLTALSGPLGLAPPLPTLLLSLLRLLRFLSPFSRLPPWFPSRSSNSPSARPPRAFASGVLPSDHLPRAVQGQLLFLTELRVIVPIPPREASLTPQLGVGLPSPAHPSLGLSASRLSPFNAFIHLFAIYLSLSSSLSSKKGDPGEQALFLSQLPQMSLRVPAAP